MPVKGPNNTMRIRIKILIAVLAFVCFFAVGIKLFYMQVIRHDFYEEQAILLQTSDTIIPPKRGTIYDRNMKELAVSASTEMIIVNPRQMKTASIIGDGDGKISLQQYREDAAEILADELDLDYDETLEKISRDTSYVVIQSTVEKDQVDIVTQALKDAGRNEGVYTEADFKRYYPYNNFASQVIGYVSGDVGMLGIEAQYDEVLRGASGRVVTAANAAGGEMPVDYEQYIPAIGGDSLVLTIDEGIQHFLEKNLESAMTDNPLARDGVSGIVMDVKTGEILAMANKPDFDINSPREIIDEAQKAELLQNITDDLAEIGKTVYLSDEYLTKGGMENLTDEVAADSIAVDIIGDNRLEQLNMMWRNKTIMDTYEPGSTFKLMNVAAAYDLQLVNEDSTFYCGGSMTVAGYSEPIYCHNRTGHGVQTLTECLMNSCNVAMMQMAFNIGGSTFYDYFEAFGLTRKTGIDLIGEASNQSLVFSAKQLVETPSNLAVSSFGQRFQATPIQMISMICAIADDGYLKTPYVVKEILDEDGNVKETTTTNIVRQVISEDTSAYMREAMQAVVDNGTGKNAYVAGYRVGGKTATSEILAEEDDVEERYTASFIGVAPMDDPQIAVLVSISDLPYSAAHGGGAIAAPVVARIMTDVLPYVGVEPVYGEDEIDRMEISTPNIIGKTAEEAKELLAEAGMKYTFIGDEEIVTDQVPSAGAKVPTTATVMVYMGGSKSTESISIPNVIGLTPTEAQSTLERYGLYMKRSGVSSVSDNYMTTSVKQSPVAGTSVGIGTVVTVEFSNNTNVDDG